MEEMRSSESENMKKEIKENDKNVSMETDSVEEAKDSNEIKSEIKEESEDEEQCLSKNETTSEDDDDDNQSDTALNASEMVETQVKDSTELNDVQMNESEATSNNESLKDSETPHLNATQEDVTALTVVHSIFSQAFDPNFNTASRSENVDVDEIDAMPESDTITLENIGERDDRRHKCTQCNYASNRKDTLKMHLKTHMKQYVKNYFCEDCDYSTFRGYDLVRHRLRLHKTVTCTICEKTFNQRFAYDFHMKKNHPEEYLEKVKPFQSNKKTEESKNSEETEKPKPPQAVIEKLSRYKCSFCEYSTNHKSNLTRHVLTHSGGKPFACTFCGYSTRTTTNLKKHIKKKHDKVS